MRFSELYRNCIILQDPSVRRLASSVQDQAVDYSTHDLPQHLTNTAKNMLIFDNEKAVLLVNYLRRYFFREVGFVSVFSYDSRNKRNRTTFQMKHFLFKNMQ